MIDNPIARGEEIFASLAPALAEDPRLPGLVAYDLIVQTLSTVPESARELLILISGAFADSNADVTPDSIRQIHETADAIVNLIPTARPFDKVGLLLNAVAVVFKNANSDPDLLQDTDDLFHTLLDAASNKDTNND